MNSVAWHPHEERVFASCSDDNTIRIWEPPPPDVDYDMSYSGPIMATPVMAEEDVTSPVVNQDKLQPQRTPSPSPPPELDENQDQDHEEDPTDEPPAPSAVPAVAASS